MRQEVNIYDNNLQQDLFASWSFYVKLFCFLRLLHVMIPLIDNILPDVENNVFLFGCGKV